MLQTSVLNLGCILLIIAGQTELLRPTHMRHTESKVP